MFDISTVLFFATALKWSQSLLILALLWLFTFFVARHDTKKCFSLHPVAGDFSLHLCKTQRLLRSSTLIRDHKPALQLVRPVEAAFSELTTSADVILQSTNKQPLISGKDTRADRKALMYRMSISAVSFAGDFVSSLFKSAVSAGHMQSMIFRPQQNTTATYKHHFFANLAVLE